MGKRKIIIITAFFLSILAGTIPVVVAVIGCIHYAEEKHLQRVEHYASEVLRTTNQTAEQLIRVFNYKDLVGNPPCSKDAIQKMLELQMLSNLLQSVAAIEGGYILCTSNGVDQNYFLGDPDGITDKGTKAWLDVSLDFAPGKTFNIYERNGLAGIVSTDQAIDLHTEPENIVLAVALQDPLLILRKRGYFNAEWSQHFLQTKETRFKTDTHWVLVSENGKVASFAALDLNDVETHQTDIAYIVLPIGVLLGIIFASLVLYAARHRLSIKADIKTALKRNEFFMQYQPVVDLQTGLIIGAESLIRWRDSEGNLIPPDLFIPVAEQSGLIKKITKEVIHMVSDDVGIIWQKKPDFHIAINLSSQDIQSDESVDLIEDFLNHHKPNKGAVVIEATERGFVDANQARSVIHGLHQLGVDIAIDDFGTGYSSLSHLESLDLNYLKIDKAFIDTLGTEAATSSVALHIIEMAKSLDLKMVAEGIETQQQADLCREKGVQYAQGWLYSKPVPIEELLMLVD